MGKRRFVSVCMCVSDLSIASPAFNRPHVENDELQRETENGVGDVVDAVEGEEEGEEEEQEEQEGEEEMERRKKTTKTT